MAMQMKRRGSPTPDCSQGLQRKQIPGQNDFFILWGPVPGGQRAMLTEGKGPLIRHGWTESGLVLFSIGPTALTARICFVLTALLHSG